MVGARRPGDFHSFQKCLIEAGYSTANTCRAGRRQDLPAAKAAQTAGDKASAAASVVFAGMRATNPALRVHYAAAQKGRLAQPAKFGMRLLVIGHGTVSLAAT